MGEAIEVRVPDLGGVEEVDVVEVLVVPGERVERDQGLLTLESDKASMDVPAPFAGVLRELRVRKGAKVREGDVIATIEASAEEAVVAGSAGGGLSSPGPGIAIDRSESGLASPGSRGGEAPAGRPGGRVVVEDPGAEVRSPRPEADISADVVVLGGGPGGYTAAFRAADLGKKVVLVERQAALGGVCLNVGCIPSKALLHAARVIEEARSFGDRGLRFGEPEIDLERLRAWKDEVVGRLAKGLETLARRREVEVVRGEGRLLSPRTLEVRGEGGRRTLAFDHAILAAGSRPVELQGLPAGDPRLIDSTGALELRAVPARLLVVGGGIIGLEMATVYGALGSAITVVELLPGLLPGCDRDLVRPLEKRLRRHLRATILLATRVAGVEPLAEGLRVTFEGDKAPPPAVFDQVLVAVGRRPNGDRLGAEAAGLRVDERGFVPVDGQQRTNVASLFAIGDLVGQPMLAHKAAHEGRVAGGMAAGEKRAFDARVVPSVAYTDPEVAWAGLTETEAEERGIAYEKGSFPWSASGRALGLGRDDGLTKLLFDPGTRRVLGAGIVGTHAGDLIAEAALAIEMGCEAGDLALTIHPHPTLSETLAFAAEAFEGTLTELYLPRKGKG
jgi:dihydrolipoamide dehydrogenase